MAKVITSYPELSQAIKEEVGRSKLQRMSKRERLAYAAEKGWQYSPPARFGTEQQVTMYETTGEQIVREEGKIVAKLKQPEKTYEQRVQEAKLRRVAGRQLAEQIQTGKLRSEAGLVILGKGVAADPQAYRALRQAQIQEELVRERKLATELQQAQQAGARVRPAGTSIIVEQFTQPTITEPTMMRERQFWTSFVEQQKTPAESFLQQEKGDPLARAGKAGIIESLKTEKFRTFKSDVFQFVGKTAAVPDLEAKFDKFAPTFAVVMTPESIEKFYQTYPNITGKTQKIGIGVFTSGLKMVRDKPLTTGALVAVGGGTSLALRGIAGLGAAGKVTAVTVGSGLTGVYFGGQAARVIKEPDYLKKGEILGETAIETTAFGIGAGAVSGLRPLKSFRQWRQARVEAAKLKEPYKPQTLEKVFVPEKVSEVKITRAGVEPTIETIKVKRVPVGYDVPDVKAAMKTQFFDPKYNILAERQTLLRPGGSEAAYYKALGIEEVRPTITTFQQQARIQQARMKGQLRFTRQILDEPTIRLLTIYEKRTFKPIIQTRLTEFYPKQREFIPRQMLTYKPTLFPFGKKAQRVNLISGLERAYSRYKSSYRVTPYKSGLIGRFRVSTAKGIKPFYFFGSVQRIEPKTLQRGLQKQRPIQRIRSIERTAFETLQKAYMKPPSLFKVDTRTHERTIFETLQKAYMKPPSLFKVDTRTQFKFASKQKTQTRQRQAFATLTSSTFRFPRVSSRYKYRYPSRKTPTRPSPFALPKFIERKRKKTKKDRRKEDRPTRYTASLIAQAFDIYGKRPKGLLTGLEIRPLPIKRRKK